MSDYDGFRARQAQARQQGRYVGIGMANYVEGTGLGPFEGVTVRVLTNGKVAVATGATNQGQGQRTTLSQIVADEVGCRIEDIVMTMADTAAIPQGVGAFASRQAINAGSSALLSGISVRRQIVDLAAATLDVPPHDIDVEDGRAIARTGNKPTLTFAELAKLAQGVPGVSFAAGQKPGLEHTSYFTPPQASYCNGTHVAEVEVDPMTGGVTLLHPFGGTKSAAVSQSPTTPFATQIPTTCIISMGCSRSAWARRFTARSRPRKKPGSRATPSMWRAISVAARSASPASTASTIARCSASMSRPVDLIATAMRR